jgi:hypothetical protein
MMRIPALRERCRLQAAVRVPRARFRGYRRCAQDPHPALSLRERGHSRSLVPDPNPDSPVPIPPLGPFRRELGTRDRGTGTRVPGRAPDPNPRLGPFRSFLSRTSTCPGPSQNTPVLAPLCKGGFAYKNHALNVLCVFLNWVRLVILLRGRATPVPLCEPVLPSNSARFRRALMFCARHLGRASHCHAP